MEVTVTDKYTILLPKELRDQLEIEEGQRFRVVITEKEITLVPILSAHELRGIFKGMSIEGYRDEEDRI